MAKQQYDNTIHFDEYHYDPHVAARFADRASNEAHEKHMRDEQKRVVRRMDSAEGARERAALALDLENVNREISRTLAERVDIEKAIQEVQA